MRFVCDSCRAQYNISDEKVGAKGVKVRCKKCGYVILVRRDVTAETAAPPPPPAEPPPPPDQAAAQDDGGIPDPDVAAPEDRTIADESMKSPLAGSEAVTDRHAQPKLSGKDETPPPGFAPTNGAGPTSFGGNGANGSPLGGLEDDEIGAVFDQVLQGGSKSTDGEQSDPGSSTLGGFAGNDSTKVISQDALRELAEAGERLGKDGSGNGAQDEESKEEVPETDWYVAVDDEQKGPLTLEKLRDMWERGEVGPDSLCWRAGYSDWTALSEVAALKQVLAPKPAKPQIVAPAMVPVPVEGSFNSGGMAHSFRSEVPMMAASPQAESGGWKPSAASALASLVSEEMSALNKPKQTRSLLESSGPIDMREAKAGGLLDVPGDDGPSNGRSPRGGGGGGLLDVPEPSSPGFSRPSPMQGYAPPASHQSPGASPYPAYTSPAPQRNKSVMVALGAVVLLLLVVVGLGVALVMKPAQNAPGEPTKVAMAAPAPAPTPPAPSPPQAAAQPAPTPPPPAPAAGSTESVPMPPPPAAPVAVAPKPIPERRLRTHAPPKNTGGGDDEGDVITPSGPAKNTGGGGGKGSHDDEFDSLFGGGGGGGKGGGDEKAPSGGGGGKKKTVFVPDAPGGGSGGGEVKDSLSTGDVMDVVVSNKAKIVECTKAKPAGTSGKLVVKWTILTSGKATSVVVQTEELKGSQMANCITVLIKGMAFPKHRTQGEPIVFPFTY